MRRQWTVAVVGAVVVLTCALAAGCSRKIDGTAVADPNAMLSTSTPSAPAKATDNPLASPPASGAPAMAQKLCTLLTFDDLPFKSQGANATNPQAATNINTDFDESCRWTYDLANPQLTVGAQLYYRKTRSLAVKEPTGRYTVAGREVLYQQADEQSCVLSLDYSDGHVGIGVIDKSKLFGNQCELGKHIAELIVSREPPTLS